MAGGRKPPPIPPPRELPSPKHRFDQALHDLTNAVAAARAFGEVLVHRARAEDQQLLDSMLKELDRVGEIVRGVRAGAYDDYAAGDVLECMRCGHTFVHRKRTGSSATCRRCRSVEVTRWKPPG